MAIKFLISPAVSVTNGSTTLNVTGSVDTYHVFNGTTIVIGNNPVVAVVEAVSGSGQPDVNGNSTITLAEPWSLADVVAQPMVAFNTNEGMAEAQRYAREAANKLIAYMSNHELLMTSTDPTVTIDIGGVATNFVPYAHLSSSAASAVATLDTLEPRITAAESTLGTIETTLATHETNAAASETNAANSAAATAADAAATAADRIQTGLDVTAAQQAAADAAAAFDNFDDKYLGSKASDPTVDNDGDSLVVGQSYWNIPNTELRFYNGAAWESPESTASQAAQSASTDAAATAADRIQTGLDVTATAADVITANDAKNISMANANFKGDWSSLTGALNIPASVKEGGVIYMLLNNVADVTLSQPSVDTANWSVIASLSSTAPDSDKLGGQLPSYYATAASISNVNNTSDANKPVSTAQQAALDSLSAQISKNKIFALAGMVL